MSARNRNLKLALMLSPGLLLSLPACESVGTARVASVGQVGPQGEAGPQGVRGQQGPAGPQGASGADGADGIDGADGADGAQGPAGGSGAGLGSLGAIAAGGLVGPGGLAGTGLLSGTGDPNSNLPVLAGVEVASGEVVNVVASRGLRAAELVDASLPGGTPITGAVVGVIKATGQTLIKTGQGEEYLLDGLTAAPGTLVTATIGQAFAVGSPEAEPLIGASLLSPGQQQGELLTVGVASNGELLSLGDQPLLAGGGASLGSSGGGLGQAAAPVSNTVETVLGTVTGGAEAGPVTLVTDSAGGGLLGGDSALLGGDGGPLAPVTTTVTDTLGGVVPLGGDGEGDDDAGLLGGALGGLLGGPNN